MRFRIVAPESEAKAEKEVDCRLFVAQNGSVHFQILDPIKANWWSLVYLNSDGSSGRGTAIPDVLELDLNREGQLDCR